MKWFWASNIMTKPHVDKFETMMLEVWIPHYLIIERVYDWFRYRWSTELFAVYFSHHDAELTFFSFSSSFRLTSKHSQAASRPSTLSPRIKYRPSNKHFKRKKVFKLIKLDWSFPVNSCEFKCLCWKHGCLSQDFFSQRCSILFWCDMIVRILELLNHTTL